ncbi:hypothetical protein [Bradyrhizobium japonicum]|jgi:hypothetical protein|uniref:hypothetical protein n=1 Tax=Bradyrhizobium japonicum TaxID=375 RepID=UPI0004B621EE|nr:hypothetical protein [Bradyrhizobium japonicum]
MTSITTICVRPSLPGDERRRGSHRNAFLRGGMDVRKPIGQIFNPFVDDFKNAPDKDRPAPSEPIRKEFSDSIFSKK